LTAGKERCGVARQAVDLLQIQGQGGRPAGLLTAALASSRRATVVPSRRKARSAK
jgi:hypothetical protein